MARPDDPGIRGLIDKAHALRDEHVKVCEKCRALGGPPWDDTPLECRPSGRMAPPDLDELWKVNRNARR